MEPTTIGILSIIFFFIVIALGIPVGFALTLTSAAGLLCIVGWAGAVATVSTIFTNWIANYNMSVIPAFILMGTLAHHSGILDDLFDTMEKWFGRLPGGLAVCAVGANAIFGACSGSIISACTVIGKSAIPRMRKAGYPDYKAAGVIAVAGTLAELIPPSITICIYGLIVSQSIGKVLMAGYIPGIITAFSYMSYIIITSRNIPRSEKVYTWREKLYSLRYLWFVLVILLFVMGSMFFGIATPTEAGSAGTFAMFLLTIVSRKISWSVFRASVFEAVRITGSVLFLIVSAVLFGRLLVISGLTKFIGELLIGSDLNRYVVLLIVAIVWIILGMLIDAGGMMVVSLPVVYPIMISLGFDPIWLGIICVKFCDIALISPPVGMAVFATGSITDIPLHKIFAGSVRFLAMDIITIILFTLFPGIVTFLPNLMMG
jgi:tripartite ATP-independent transporter DctM subunit